jgi:CRP/FNR family transcriptional regulator, cyclic AMP receptor protein
MASSKKAPVDLELLTGLAKRFVNFAMWKEAEELFELALRLDAGNRGVQLSLAQVRNQLKREQGGLQKNSEEALREIFRRNAIDAGHFFGLASLYEERGNPALAAECLEIAFSKEMFNPGCHKLHGKLTFRERQYDRSRDALRTAQRYDPFDREIAELLGRVEYERESYREAIEATIDAFLLLPEEHDADEARRLKDRIKTLKGILKLSSQEVVQVFRERRIKLQTAFDRLDLQRERYLQDKLAAREAAAKGDDAERESGRILLAARLREFEIWKRLNDEHVFALTRAAFPETLEAGTKLFSAGDPGADLYLIEKGELQVRVPTAYGAFELAKLPGGVILGELGYIARHKRSADAVALSQVQLVRLDGEELDLLVEERPDLGVKVFACFWQSLAQKLRGANEQLRTFFEADAAQDALHKSRQKMASQGSRLDNVDSSTKIDLLREQGLTGAELQTLADFSNVKRFPSGTFLFHEGDPGNEMYVVLEGKVMISKYIPGGGEEALAILERGDFFGEMSLIDGQPRSADAKAYQGALTVIAFDELTIKEVQSVDPRAAVDFIRLLCRLMCKRLREIDDKVTGWRIMSGQRGDGMVELSTELPAIFAEP